MSVADSSGVKSLTSLDSKSAGQLTADNARDQPNAQQAKIKQFIPDGSTARDFFNQYRHDISPKHKTPDLSIGGFELLHLDSNQGQRD